MSSGTVLNYTHSSNPDKIFFLSINELIDSTREVVQASHHHHIWHSMGYIDQHSQEIVANCQVNTSETI
jgi:hypothetical protein